MVLRMQKIRFLDPSVLGRDLLQCNGMRVSEKGRGLSSAMNAQLAQDAVYVVLSRRDGDAQFAGNLLVREALVDQLKYTALGWGKED